MNIIYQWTPELIEQLHYLYQNEWWSKERSKEETASCIAGSQICLGVVDANGRLQGFSRVVTDYVFKAFIFDVIVAPQSRSLKLGQLLINTIKTHPELQKVKHFELYCLPELKAYYGQFGFSDEVSGMGLMRYVNGAQH